MAQGNRIKISEGANHGQSNNLDEYKESKYKYEYQR